MTVKVSRDRWQSRAASAERGTIPNAVGNAGMAAPVIAA